MAATLTPRFEITSREVGRIENRTHSGYLNDNLIDWGMTWGVKNTPDAAGNVYAIAANALSALIKVDIPLASSQLKRIQNTKVTLIPIQADAKDVHWSMLIAMPLTMLAPKLKRGAPDKPVTVRALIHTDSLSWETHRRSVDKIAKKMSGIQDMPCVVFSTGDDLAVTQQEDKYNCGIFAIEYACRMVQWRAAKGFDRTPSLEELKSDLARDRILTPDAEDLDEHLRKVWTERLKEDGPERPTTPPARPSQAKRSVVDLSSPGAIDLSSPVAIELPSPKRARVPKKGGGGGGGGGDAGVPLFDDIGEEKTEPGTGAFRFADISDTETETETESDTDSETELSGGGVVTTTTLVQLLAGMVL